MTAEWHETLIAEVELIQAFIRIYRAKLGDVIFQMNESISGSSSVKPPSQAVCWCVEAVDMMLSSHARFAQAMEELAKQVPAVEVQATPNLEPGRQTRRGRLRNDPPRPPNRSR